MCSFTTFRTPSPSPSPSPVSWNELFLFQRSCCSCLPTALIETNFRFVAPSLSVGHLPSSFISPASPVLLFGLISVIEWRANFLIKLLDVRQELKQLRHFQPFRFIFNTPLLPEAFRVVGGWGTTRTWSNLNENWEKWGFRQKAH